MLKTKVLCRIVISIFNCQRHTHRLYSPCAVYAHHFTFCQQWIKTHGFCFRSKSDLFVTFYLFFIVHYFLLLIYFSATERKGQKKRATNTLVRRNSIVCLCCIFRKRKIIIYLYALSQRRYCTIFATDIEIVYAYKKREWGRGEIEL